MMLHKIKTVSRGDGVVCSNLFNSLEMETKHGLLMQIVGV